MLNSSARAIQGVLSPAMLLTLAVAPVVAQEETADSTSAAPVEARTEAKTGARVGLVIGGITGAAFFLLIGAVAESEGEDISPAGLVGLGALGAGLGVLSGVLVGALFGSMIHKDTEEPSAESPSFVRRTIASVSIEPGVGHLTERPGNESSLLVRASLIAQLKPWLGLGPEVTYAAFADGMYGFGGAFYLGSRDRGLRPYGVLDMGYQHWSTSLNEFDPNQSVLGMGAGAGISWRPGSGNVHLGLESRYHWSPQNLDQNEAYRFVSLGGTARVAW